MQGDTAKRYPTKKTRDGLNIVYAISLKVRQFFITPSCRAEGKNHLYKSGKIPVTKNGEFTVFYFVFKVSL